MLKIVIVEDDNNHIAQIQDFLKVFIFPIEIIGIATSVEDAIFEIKQKKPHLLLLDIQLENGETGFDVLKKIDKPNFDIIFTTAHIDNNIQEIRRCSVDYIVKPYIYSEVKETLEKYLLSPKNASRLERLDYLRSNIMVGNIDQKTTIIQEGNTFTQLRIGQIFYLEADNDNTFFYFSDNEGKPAKIYATHGLKYWEDRLNDCNFCKISRKHVINFKHFSKFLKGDGTVVLTNGTELSLTSVWKDDFLRRMKG